MRQIARNGGDLQMMEPEHTATAVEPSVSLNLDYNSVVDVAFLRTAAAEGLTTILGGGWITRSSIDGAPGEVLAEADYFHSARDETLVRLPEGICHLILSERSLIVRIAARDRASAMRVRGEVLAALPEVESGDREVPVRFWWWQPAVARDLARMLPSPSWREIEENYVEPTREQLAGLMGWREAPPAGGRLLLWHGEPGTGKTSAIRSLTGEWRSWAEFHFITDPEELLRNPSYLLSTLSDRRTSQASGPADRWRVLVLEDAGEYLVPEAKHVEGQALSRLLNICDGVLGQAMRALVLVTTNEPLRTLHPALARPGRCLAEVSFERFAESDVARWAAVRGSKPPAVTSATLAELYAFEEGRSEVLPERQPVGFAAAR